MISLALRNRMCIFSATFRTQKKHIFLVILIVIHLCKICLSVGAFANGAWAVHRLSRAVEWGESSVGRWLLRKAGVCRWSIMYGVNHVISMDSLLWASVTTGNTHLIQLILIIVVQLIQEPAVSQMELIIGVWIFYFHPLIHCWGGDSAGQRHSF